MAPKTPHASTASTAGPVAPSRHATPPPALLKPEAPIVRGARPIKVRALQMGYYDHARRRVGDVFFIKDELAFSTKWMERVDVSTPERLTTSKQAIEQQHDEILSGRTPGPSSDDKVL
jgi:hypothetical protein